jgi:hypothetical protein
MQTRENQPGKGHHCLDSRPQNQYKPMKNNYKPNELKFFAIVDGKRINAGDFWFPRGMNNANQLPNPSNCHPVTISSAGVHYSKKLKDESWVQDNTGKTYYGDWEHTQTCDSCELHLIN